MTSSYDDPDASRRPDRGDWAGQRAMAWVIDDAPVPAALFPTLMVIARRCNEHGKGSYQSVATIAEKTGKSDAQVKRDIRDLKKLGLLLPGDESLVAAFPMWKRPAVYDVPLHISGPKPTRESKNATGGKRQGGGMDAPPVMDATGSHGCTDRGGMDAPPPGGMDATQTKPLNNPMNNPSLSPREDDGDTSPLVQLEPEREIVDASQEPENRNPIYRLLLDAGCPAEQLDDVQGELIARHEPRSPAWWRTVAKNGDLPGLIAEVLEALQPMNQPVTAAQADNTHPFTPKDDNPDDCELCPFPVQNGRHRVGNQGGGYVAQVMTIGADQNRQPRQRSMSPADQRVAEGTALYRKYKAQENGAPR